MTWSRNNPITIRYSPPIHGNWQIPTKARGQKLQEMKLCPSTYSSIHERQMAFNLIGKFRKKRFIRFNTPKTIRSVAPNFPIKCGVLKRCKTFKRLSSIKNTQRIFWQHTYSPNLRFFFFLLICIPKEKQWLGVK